MAMPESEGVPRTRPEVGGRWAAVAETGVQCRWLFEKLTPNIRKIASKYCSSWPPPRLAFVTKTLNFLESVARAWPSPAPRPPPVLQS